MSERVYCSEVAKDDRVQLAGTAVQVDVWLLIEYPRPWKPKALSDNDLEPRVRAHLADLETMATGLGIRLRIQFIKQGASTDRAHPLIYLVDTRDMPVQLCGRLHTYANLLELNGTHPA